MTSFWRNWAGNQQCAPASINRPTTEQELARIVCEATSAGQRVKVVGAGHSFTGIALSDGRLISLDNYGEVLSTDYARRQVTVQAGIRLHRLNEELDARDLALPNLGDIDQQSIAGAVSTGTHGTGRDFYGIATQIAGMRLITADGSIIDCSPEEHAEVFDVARVGLGALGVLSAVTLQCVPAFRLHAIEEPARVDAVLEALDEHVAHNDHFEFYWVPHTGWALTKRNQRTDEPAAPRARWREFRDDILMNNVAFGVMCRIGRARTSLIPRLARLASSAGRLDYVDKSYKVFCSPRKVRFYEMEYAIPAEAAAEALNRVRRFVDRNGLRISFPVEVRFVAGDDIPLSMGYGRDTCYIAVHVYQGMPYQQYFEAVEDIMNDYEGRPHWGKLHFQTAETLARRYPEWERFQEARRQLDPEGRFSNRYLTRVLGSCQT